jgi:hypothetical protein
MSAICLLLLLLFADQPKSNPSPSPSASPPAPPTVTVSLQRSVIREQDSLPATIWISNQSSQPLTGVQVDITKPGFLELSTPQCDGKFVETTVTFGDVPANSSVNCKLHLITTKDREIVVGDYNLLFTVRYQWQDNTGVHKSVVTAEKPLKVTLLGTDTVAGIPLALAGFIVPGLFFWIAVRLLKVPWGVDLPLGDKTIYSVIISALFMIVGAWYNYFNVNNGISLNKLFYLAGSGFALGLLVAAAYHDWHWWSRKRMAANQISFDDTEEATLGKILRLNPHYNAGSLRRLFARIFPAGRYTKPETRVKLKNGKEYVGALGIRNGDLVALVSWRKVEVQGTSNQTKARAKQLEDDGDLLALFRFATENNLAMSVVDRIRDLGDNSAHNGPLIFTNSEVAYVRSTPNRRPIEPLSVG